MVLTSLKVLYVGLCECMVEIFIVLLGGGRRGRVMDGDSPRWMRVSWIRSVEQREDMPRVRAAYRHGYFWRLWVAPLGLVGIGVWRGKWGFN